MVPTLHGCHSCGIITWRLPHILWSLWILHLSLSILTTTLRWIRYWVIWRYAVLGIWRINSRILHGSFPLYLLTTTRCCAQHKFWIRSQELWDNRKVEIMEENLIVSNHQELFLPCISAWLCCSCPGYGYGCCIRFVPLCGLAGTCGCVWAAS